MTEKQYAPTKVEKKVSEKKKIAKPMENQKTEIKNVEKNEEKKESENKKETKTPIQKKPKVKKEEAVVNAKDLSISTKYSAAICKFIKYKPISVAIKELEEVMAFKRAIPVKGEIPHRKGKIMSGRYITKTTQHFIKLLKSLNANANMHEIEEPIISFAMANMASKPYGKFGRVRKKRSHVTIKARSKKENKKNKSKSIKKMEEKN